MDGDEISPQVSGQEEIRRENEDNTLFRNRYRPGLNVVRRRQIIEQLDNARDGPVPPESYNNLPPGLREQLEDDSPYFLCPLPQPLHQRQNAVGGERRIAVPASILSEFAAR